MFCRTVLQDIPTNHLMLLARRCYQKDVAVIGFPFGGGQAKKSAENTPRVFRENGLLEKIQGDIILLEKIKVKCFKTFYISYSQYIIFTYASTYEQISHMQLVGRMRMRELGAYFKGS